MRWMGRNHLEPPRPHGSPWAWLSGDMGELQIQVQESALAGGKIGSLSIKAMMCVYKYIENQEEVQQRACGRARR